MTIQELVGLVEKCGGVRGAARHLGCAHSGVSRRLERACQRGEAQKIGSVWRCCGGGAPPARTIAARRLPFACAVSTPRAAAAHTGNISLAQIKAENDPLDRLRKIVADLPPGELAPEERVRLALGISQRLWSSFINDERVRCFVWRARNTKSIKPGNYIGRAADVKTARAQMENVW
jgi:hypothetical protein